MSSTIVQTNDLLLNITGGSIGRCAVVPIDFKEGNVSQHVCIIRPLLVNSEYLHTYILSDLFWSSIKLTGSGREGLPKYNLEQMLLPLPPLKEQIEIVRTLRKFLELLSQIKVSQNLLSENICRIKSKILDLAMQGKLVQQDPSDEPAADMLRRINPKARIISDNPHLRNIPKEWCWVKLKDICIKIVDGDHNPPMGHPIDTGFYMISASNIVNDDITISPSRFITEDQFIICNNRTNVSKGDVLLTTVGTIGRTAIFSLSNSEK